MTQPLCDAHKKNVMDNILGTLLDITGKTKDNHKARKDLKKMGLR
jgi:hypothetical protein